MATLKSAAERGDLLAMAFDEEIRRRVTQAIDDEAAGISERVIKRLREEVGSIAGALISNYDMNREGRIITIRVQVGPDNTKELG